MKDTTLNYNSVNRTKYEALVCPLTALAELSNSILSEGQRMRIANPFSPEQYIEVAL